MVASARARPAHSCFRSGFAQLECSQVKHEAEGCRRSAFEIIDRPAMKALPATR
jgi:hypothetical protein